MSRLINAEPKNDVICFSRKGSCAIGLDVIMWSYRYSINLINLLIYWHSKSSQIFPWKNSNC